ncbi:MAG: hypothetical protein QXV01_07495, partial [Candidatus Bathyarchaeia archaeon]
NGYGGIELTCVDLNIVSNITVSGQGSGVFEFVVAKLEKIDDGLESKFQSLDLTYNDSIDSLSIIKTGYVKAYEVWQENVAILSSEERRGTLRVIYRSSNRWQETTLNIVRRLDGSMLPFAGIVLKVDLGSPIIMIFDVNTLKSVNFGIFSPINLSNFTGVNVYPHRSRLVSDKDTFSLFLDTINFFYLFKLKANSTYLFTLFKALEEKSRLSVEYEIMVFDIDSTGSLTEIGQILFHGSSKPLSCTRVIVNTAEHEKNYLVWVYCYPLPKDYLDTLMKYYNVTIEEVNYCYFWILDFSYAQELKVNSRILGSAEGINLYKIKLAPGVYHLSIDIQTELSGGKISLFSIHKPYEEFLISSTEESTPLYFTVSENSEYFLQVTSYTKPFLYYLKINYALDLRSYEQLIDNIRKMNESLDFPINYLITSKSLIEIESMRRKVFEYYNKGDALNALALSNDAVNRINNEIRLAQIVLIIVFLVGGLFGIFNKNVGWGTIIALPTTFTLTLVAQGYHLLFAVTAVITYITMVCIGYKSRKLFLKRKSVPKLSS